MFGLLIKDFFNIRKQIAWYIGMIVMFFVVSLSVRNLTFSASIGLLVTISVPLTALAYEERENWQRFAAASGLDAKTMVAEKYLLGILFALFSSLAYLAVFLFCFENGTTWVEFAVPICLQFVILSLILPLVFKYGTERGRTMSVVIVAVIVVVFVTVMGIWGKGFRPAPLVVCLLSAAIALVLLVGSFFLSLKIYEKKEF